MNYYNIFARKFFIFNTCYMFSNRMCDIHSASSGSRLNPLIQCRVRWWFRFGGMRPLRIFCDLQTVSPGEIRVRSFDFDGSIRISDLGNQELQCQINQCSSMIPTDYWLSKSNFVIHHPFLISLAGLTFLTIVISNLTNLRPIVKTI